MWACLLLACICVLYAMGEDQNLGQFAIGSCGTEKPMQHDRAYALQSEGSGLDVWHCLFMGSGAVGRTTRYKAV